MRRTTACPLDPPIATAKADIGKPSCLLYPQKGKPFAPDARMKKILTDSAAVGQATARALTYRSRLKEGPPFPNSAWETLFVGGYKFEHDGVRVLDARTFYFFYATVNPPAMEEKNVGKGSQYAAAFVDAKGQPLDGGKTYKLHLPPNIPAKDFCSVVLYDNQTRSMLQTDEEFPNLGSQKNGIVINEDKSADVYFGPKAPAGKESNWIQTIPGKGWNAILRLYGPLQPWFDKTWKPGEIEERSSFSSLGSRRHVKIFDTHFANRLWPRSRWSR
jgi:hypothetical protein